MFPRGDGVILQMRARLSVMMFLEYFVWGAWYVTLGTWLGQTLHFSGDQIGIISGTTTIGAILSPFLVGLMADELFANQRLLACSTASAACSSGSPPPKLISGPCTRSFSSIRFFTCRRWLSPTLSPSAR